MSSTQIPHHRALGVHPAAYVNPEAPILPDDTLDSIWWVNNAAGPPFPVMLYDQTSATWSPIQMDATGYPLPDGSRLEVVT